MRLHEPATHSIDSENNTTFPHVETWYASAIFFNSVVVTPDGLWSGITPTARAMGRQGWCLIV